MDDGNFNNKSSEHRKIFEKLMFYGTITSIFETLVGGLNPSEKYEFVSWDYYSQYSIWEKKNTCSKPPTSYVYTIKNPS